METQAPGAEPVVRIGDFDVGAGQPCLIIAEAGVNHNGDLDRACALVDAAVAAGCSAVKFQIFRADALASPVAPKAAYQKERTGDSGTQLEMLRSLELPPAAFRRIREHCGVRRIMFLASPFDEPSADFLACEGVAAFKIGSGELSNTALLTHVARHGRPVILSTGMSYLAEVELAVRALQAAADLPLVLLHCVSNYPAAPEDVNLRAMRTLAQAFRVPVGFSDHTRGIEVALAARALGACVIEKHLTLDRSLPGPDHAASLEPGEMATLVRGIRIVEAALGDGRKVPAASERDTMAAARRSLTAAVDLPPGACLTRDLIRVRRPGTGLPPSALELVLGRRVRAAVPEGTPLTLEMLE